MDVSRNSGTPKSSMLIIRVFHYTPEILGYPYFWKHPYTHMPTEEHHDVVLSDENVLTLSHHWPRVDRSFGMCHDVGEASQTTTINMHASPFHFILFRKKCIIYIIFNKKLCELQHHVTMDFFLIPCKRSIIPLKKGMEKRDEFRKHGGFSTSAIRAKKLTQV